MKKSLVRAISTLLLFIIVASSDASVAIAKAQSNVLMQQDANTVGEMGGYLVGNILSTDLIFSDHKFAYKNGHGFAAERVNNLVDMFSGFDAVVVGDDNAKNGADRLIRLNDGGTILIQDKYYQSAYDSVNAAFDDVSKLYRYTDASGKPMQLEVPKDQYDAAVELMKAKIEQGLVPGIDDPKEAENIVRKGHLTYKQSVNIAKAGTVESLAYDASKGIVSAACAGGITFVMDFMWEVINGIDVEYAIKNAALNALKSGGIAFATTVIAAQLARTGLMNAFAPTTTAIAEALGPAVQQAIVQSTGQTVAVSTAGVVSQVSKILSTSIITNIVLIVVLTSIDAVELFRGRISKEQFLENLAVAVLGVGLGAAGAIAGGAIGSAIYPGIGTAIGAGAGGLIGGIGGSVGGNALITHFFETDSEEMYAIISENFASMAEDYMITQEEADIIADELKNKLSGSTLKDMYASEDREAFAEDILDPLFMEVVAKRPAIEMPSDYEIRQIYKNNLEGIIFIH